MSSRPQSAYTRGGTPASMASRTSTKSAIRKLIDGDEGPPMEGVTSYPYTRSQAEYLEDFQALVANTIDHPYMATTAFNRNSSPHDLLYGSNFDDDRLGAAKKWKTTYQYSWDSKDHLWAKNTLASGVRSENVQFLG